MTMISPKLILVTGGAGFIGSALIRHVVGEQGCALVNIDKLTYAANLENVRSVKDSPLYHFEQADICDRPAIDAIFARYQPDAIVHLAAESHGADHSIL